jgi:hypothetical protein
MSIQVYKKGNYIVLIDSADSLYREDFARDVKVSKSTLASTDYNIYHDGKLYKDVAFADLRDEANIAYVDVATWETFYQDNTGGFDVATTGSVTAVANDLATHEASDGSSHTFIDQDVTSGSSPTFDGTNFTNIPLAGTADGLEIEARNSSGGVLSKGQAVYISGYHVGSDTPEIDKADADLGGAYPCIGLVKADILNNANGQIITQGKLSNLDTSAWSVGTQLYMSIDPNTTFGLTATKPTGTAQIQPIAEVLRSHATMGVLQVARLNAVEDVPNIPNGQIWIGNGSGVATPTTLDKSLVGLGNVDNTSDANKPVSTAQQTALDLKANLISPSFTTPSLGVATATSVNSTTIPSSKTLVVTTDKLSVMASTTSSELAGVISDETGTGQLCFATSPTLITPVLGVATATSVGIGGAVDSSSLFGVTSTTKGTRPFPSMTTAQRNAITSPATGLFIYNTDRRIHEWYDGQVWLNPHLVKRQNKTGVTVAVGNPVLHDSANEDGVLRTNVLGQIAVFGVVVDGNLANDGWLTVAVAGEYDVLMNGTVTRNQLVRNSTTTGEAEGTSSGATGAFAITKQTRSGGGSSLVKCWIHKMDTF